MPKNKRRKATIKRAINAPKSYDDTKEMYGVNTAPNAPVPTPHPTPVSTTRVSHQEEGSRFELELEDDDNPVKMAILDTLERMSGGMIRRKRKNATR